jgi:transcriptional regulator with XRE-family HTH domain
MGKKMSVKRNMDLRSIIAYNLRRLRREHELSQETLAHNAKVDSTYLGRVERGTTYVSIRILGRLVDILKCEPAEFLKLPPKQRRLAAKRGLAKRSEVR